MFMATEQRKRTAEGTVLDSLGVIRTQVQGRLFKPHQEEPLDHSKNTRWSLQAKLLLGRLGIFTDIVRRLIKERGKTEIISIFFEEVW